MPEMGDVINRLTEHEKISIFDALKELFKKEERIISICAYGSRVAGFARADSDYDILMVLEDYRQKVKYKYLKKDVELSILIVDKGSLVKDAEEASLGEFVCGRLLNIFEILEGTEFIKDVETRFKKRVILEILDEIISNFGILSTDFIIPIEYCVYFNFIDSSTFNIYVVSHFPQTYV